MAPLPDAVRNMPRVYIQQGEAIVTTEPLVLQTTLGSCVSVTVHDPVTGIGGMCHAVMPEASDDSDHSLRYVDQAIEHLCNAMAEHKIPRHRVTAKVIGGSSVAPRSPEALMPTAVGPQNVLTAFDRLAHAGLKVGAHDTGGKRGRRLLFVVPTGDVYVHALRRRSTDR